MTYAAFGIDEVNALRCGDHWNTSTVVDESHVAAHPHPSSLDGPEGRGERMTDEQNDFQLDAAGPSPPSAGPGDPNSGHAGHNVGRHRQVRSAAWTFEMAKAKQ